MAARRGTEPLALEQTGRASLFRPLAGAVPSPAACGAGEKVLQYSPVASLCHDRGGIGKAILFRELQDSPQLRRGLQVRALASKTRRCSPMAKRSVMPAT